MKRSSIMFAAIAAASAAFATPMLIPAPREMTMTGGLALVADNAPKVEVVASIPPEGYELLIATNGVTIRHSDAAGLFYAKATLAQLRADATDATLPCLEIKDAPAFRWRGVHLDVARHFFGKEAVKRLLDQMALYKYNVFHWHLTDDQAWTFEVPGYRRLVRDGAFYGDGDIREIVEYARARHISVVPEIDFPGHFGAVRRAYPQFACPGGKPMCVGNEEAVAFAENVLDRVCELFPGVPIHIGGDECAHRFWGKCPKCLELVKREGLSGVEEIQPWLTRRLAKRLSAKGRRTIGWDEIAVGAKKRDGAASGAISAMFPKTALVMGRWPDALAMLANAGCEVVRCDYPHCYFDYSQAVPGDRHGYFGKLKTPLEKVYAFNPFDGIRPEARVNVLGGECCNWTERTTDVLALDWKLWPRALALSEILWTNPDPAKRDFAEFSARAAEHRRRLIRDHVNCAPLK